MILLQIANFYNYTKKIVLNGALTQTNKERNLWESKKLQCSS